EVFSSCYMNQKAIPIVWIVDSVRSVFIGYPSGYKGYKLYDPIAKKIFISRDVTFVESEFSFQQSSKTSSTIVDIFPDVVMPLFLPDVTPSSSSPATNVEPQLQQVSASSQAIPTTEPRRTSRPSRPPPYLKDYQCHNVYHMNFKHLSQPHCAFIANVAAIPEPAFFHQALSLSSPLRHCAVASQLLAVVAIPWRHHLVPLLLTVAAHLPPAVGPSLLSRTTPRPRCSVAQLLALAAQLAQLRFTKGSTAQWLFSSKVYAVPHLMSFKVSQDEKPFDSTLKFPAPEQVSHYLPSLSLSLNSSEID
ncbi:hypothetical protein S245_011218, partial [Arachis hypogaea]